MTGPSVEVHPPMNAGAGIRVHLVSVDETGRWLAKGWRDMWRTPWLTLGYGLIFPLVGLVLYQMFEAGGRGALFLPAFSGFMLIAPFLAVPFLISGRRQQLGESVNLGAVVGDIWAIRAPLSILGFVLLALWLAWMLTSLVAFSVFYGGSVGASLEISSASGFIVQVFGAAQGPLFLVVVMALGAIMATMAFAISVLSVPAVVDGDLQALPAMGLSLSAVRANVPAMFGWAAALVLMISVGAAVFMIGLWLAVPLAGHASWHAYRGLTED